MNATNLTQWELEQQLERKFRKAASAMLLTGATECRVMDTPFTLIRCNSCDFSNLTRKGLSIHPQRWKYHEIEFFRCSKIRPSPRKRIFLLNEKAALLS